MWLWVSTYITCHMHRKRRQCIEEFKGISQWSHFHLVWGRQKHLWYVFIYKNIYAGLNYIKIILLEFILTYFRVSDLQLGETADLFFQFLAKRNISLVQLGLQTHRLKMEKTPQQVTTT